MKSFFYTRLAYTNIKNNSKMYFPYILTCIGTILMFYNMCALAYHPSTGKGTLGNFMTLGVFITGIFSAIFLFYTNSFLIKRRKKEFGLFNILGMEKRHIGKIIVRESVIVSAVSLIIGLLSGVLFNKLITLLLYKLIRFNPNYSFEISFQAIAVTLVLFVLVFILTLLSSLSQVRRAKPIELLAGGSVGEKEPRSNIFLAIVGLLALGGGYYIAVCTENLMAVFFLFFPAAILVAVGTYCLFTAGSIVILKALKRNKAFYYQTKHFVSLSGMLYRMKKNAVGLANICIMSTAVLVMVSTTISMYSGMNDLMAHRYPSDVAITGLYTAETKKDSDVFLNKVTGFLSESGAGAKGVTSYEYVQFSGKHSGNTYVPYVQGENVSSDKMSALIFIPAADYNAITGSTIALGKDEAVIYAKRDIDSLEVFGKTFSVKQCISDKSIPIGRFRAWAMDVVFIVVDNSDTVSEMFDIQNAAYGENASEMCRDIVFNFDNSTEDAAAYSSEVLVPFLKALKSEGYNLTYDVKQLNIESFYELYGGLFFLGIFLGFLFMLAMVLIIYYKQVIEGFEDRERFKIMRNIGMSNAEVKQAIGSQISTVFALPLIVAVVHITAAFPILTKMLELLNLRNISVFVACTIGTILVFAVVYALVYWLTSKVYYKIINS